MKRSSKAFFVLMLVSCCGGSVFAQRFSSTPPPPVQIQKPSGDEDAERAYVAFKAGDLDLARKYLTLANPSSPYAMYVKAALTPDATEAADMYKEIVAENHGAPIAGEALLKLYKYHYAAGDYASAHTDYVELKKYRMSGELVDPAGFEDSLRVPAPQKTQPVARTPAPPAPPAPSASYAVQVGVFTTPENARRFIDQLQQEGVNGSVFTKDAGGRFLYAVSAGTFSTREAAEKYASDLRSRSIDCMVVQR